MKPICATCNLFMKMARAGEYFEERMPGPTGARREPAADPDCPSCQGSGVYKFCPDKTDSQCNGCESEPCECLGTRVKPGPLDDWQPYKLWVGDLWRCRGCGAEIIVGVPHQPLSEHYKPDFAEALARFQPKRQVDDC